jgi:hypothetical protein
MAIRYFCDRCPNETSDSGRTYIQGRAISSMICFDCYEELVEWIKTKPVLELKGEEIPTSSDLVSPGGRFWSRRRP